MTGEHLGQVLHGGTERGGRFLVMALHANADEDSQAKSDRIAIQCCMIASDDTRFFEHLDAAQAGERAKGRFSQPVGHWRAGRLPEVP